MKRIFITWIFHGNMQYDRWPKSYIRKDFPRIYDMVVQDFLRYPELKGHVQLSGVTLESLEQENARCLAGLRELYKRGQVLFTGTYYSEPVNVSMDGETNLRCAELGTAMVRRMIGKANGFFPQEQAYHPQLPWIVDQLGLEWVSIYDLHRTSFYPFILRGLDGTQVVGIPIHQIFRQDMYRQLENLWDNAQGNELYTFVGDFELPPKLDDVAETVEQLRRQGKTIEFTTIPDYLEEFGTKDEEFYTPCSWTETVENPSFVRWTADPQDIIVHKSTATAMSCVSAAEMLASITENLTGSTPNQLWEDVVKHGNPLMRDSLTWAIECPDDFPDIEATYLAVGREPTVIDKAWHLLLWGVNSDARGWYPMIEKRRERILSLDNAAYLANRVATKSLVALAEESHSGSARSASLLVFNPAHQRKVVLRLKGPVPYQLAESAAGQNTITSQADGYLSEMEVDLPGYGIKSIPIEICDGSLAEEKAWRIGSKISKDGLSLEVVDTRLILDNGHRQWTMGLKDLGRFGIREVHRGTVVHRSPYEVGPTFVRQRDGLYPELKVEKQLDWCIYFTASYRLELDRVVCSLRLEFTKPVLLGGSTHSGNSRIWFPDGLTYQIQGRPGQIWYDVPFGNIKHVNQELSYITALRYAFLQEDEGGIAIMPRSGNQLYEVSADAGVIGLSLGGSTLGTPAEPATQTLIPEEWVVLQDNRWEEEPFFGVYEHEFAVYPFNGTWQVSSVPAKAEEFLAPVLYTVGASSDNVSRSLIELHEPGVRITSVSYADTNRLSIRLVEELGRDRRLTIGFLGRQREIELQAYGIATVYF